MVSLDSDPDNYSSVVRVSQEPEGQVNLDPLQNAINFTGLGTLKANTNEFIVRPNLEIDSGTGFEYVPEWKTELIATGSYDDTAMFTVTANWDRDAVENNTLVVNTVGMNLTGRTLTAVLKVSLVDAPETFTVITLNQDPIDWSAPGNPKAISADGGTTAQLRITVPEGLEDLLHYTVTVRNATPNTMEGHFAYALDFGDGDTTPYSKLQPNEASKSFKIGFPKLIWPNIGVEPSVKVAVTLVETGEVQTFTLKQSAIDQRAVNILDVGLYLWGNLSSTAENATWSATWAGPYQVTFSNNLNPTNAAGSVNFGPSGIVKSSYLALASAHSQLAWNDVWPVVLDDVSFINYTNPSLLPGPNATIWSWMINGSDNFALINTEGTISDGAADFASYIPGQLGLTGGGGAPTVPFGLNPDYTNRIMAYLLNGPFGVVNNKGITFSNSGTNGYINTASVTGLANGAVPVLIAPNTTSGNICVLMIDPSRNVVVKCDSEIFNAITNLDPDRYAFMRNLLGYMVNNTQYGSNFSDYFWDSPRAVMVTPKAQQ